MHISKLNTLTLGACIVFTASTAYCVNLLSNPGFESFDNSINDAVLETSGYYATYTSPVTVAAADSNFTGFIGTWAAGGAGNGIVLPIETGNDSTRATGNRKAARYIQILPLDTILNGDQIQVDWRYGVSDTYTSDVSFQIEVFGLNEATGLEAATTFTGALVFGGEVGNSAILATTVVSLTYNAGDTLNDDIDGLWHDAPTTIVNITQDWDYIGVAIKRNTGIGNSTAAQTDDVSLQVIPEPATTGILIGSLALLLTAVRRRRSEKA